MAWLNSSSTMLFTLLCAVAVPAVYCHPNLRRYAGNDEKDAPRRNLLFDPKTVVHKHIDARSLHEGFTGDNSILQADYEGVAQWHSTLPEKIVPPSARKADDDIRYAAFGSSMTWGSTLKNRDVEAYVKKLSLHHGDNYGIRSSGPNYPAACTKSILGDEEYDVFVIEFFTVANEGMMELIQRLRERFPDAIVVIARLWDTGMIDNVHGQNIRWWANAEKNLGVDWIHKPEFRKMFYEEFEQNEWHWQFQTTHKKWIEVHEHIARETGSYIVPMMWSEHPDGDDGYLAIGDKLLGSDSFHLSAAGHEDFANRVRALVNRVGVPKKPRIGQFSGGDICLNWFQTGIIGEGLKMSKSAVVRKMPNTEKYGLEFEGEDNTGWIETAPSDELMHLFVAYMSTAPAPSKYPKTEARRIDDVDGTSVIIDPVAGWGSEQNHVHVSSMVYLGQVPPQRAARVYFRPIEESEWPFRIVQVVLTAKADFGSSYGSMPNSGRLNGINDE